MMLVENAVLLITGAILIVAALTVTFFIGREVWFLLKEFVIQYQETRSLRQQNNNESQHEKDSYPQERSPAFKDRSTVERMIDYFEEEPDRPR